MQPDFAAILKRYWGFDRFRELQLEVIRSVYAGRDTLALMPTGGGKSIVYQVAALAREGVCVVITPLISLMKDQVDKLRSKRILAESIHAGMRQRDIDRILDNCVYGDVRFLFISPERIDSELFRMRFSKMTVSLVAVDEAHCISQWGYDFRPAYLRIARLREIQPDPPVLALTASATPDVCRDIMRQLHFREERLFRMDFSRKNLSFLVRQSDDKYEQMMRIIGNVPGTGIVYVRTRERAEQLAQYLCEHGIAADFYHGGLGFFVRNARQDRWIGNETRVMVATNAFGMGIDKADVRFVIHFDLCDSIEAYYQEAGRAGRDGKPAYAVLLLSGDEKYKAGKRIEVEFPTLEQIRRIYEGVFNFLQIAIGEGRGRSQAIDLYELSRRLKVFTPTLLNALKILQQNGYMSLTEEMELPARIRFIVRRDELYRIRVLRRELDHLITVLLRKYTGLFSDFVAIDETHLAETAGYTADHVRELLKKLWQLHIIRYIPGGKTPLLQFTEERLPVSDLVITPESYRIRKQTTLKRVEAMFEYAYCTDRCRSVLMQRYFGQQDAEPCGKCDPCRAARKTRLSAAPKMPEAAGQQPHAAGVPVPDPPEAVLSTAAETARSLRPEAGAPFPAGTGAPMPADRTYLGSHGPQPDGSTGARDRSETGERCAAEAPPALAHTTSVPPAWFRDAGRYRHPGAARCETDHRPPAGSGGRYRRGLPGRPRQRSGERNGVQPSCSRSVGRVPGGRSGVPPSGGNTPAKIRTAHTGNTRFRRMGHQKTGRRHSRGCGRDHPVYFRADRRRENNRSKKRKTPFKSVTLGAMKHAFRENIQNDEVNLLPVGAFAGRIHIVDSTGMIAEACDYLCRQPVIGFDTETRPSFTRGASNKISLLQLSSADEAFLFRLNKTALERPILRLLESRDVRKIGAAIRDDIKGLQQLRHFNPRNFVDLQNIVGDYGIQEKSLRKMAAIVMGVRVSKAQRLSNWEAVSLTPAQQLYAATDAWVTRELYMRLTESESDIVRP